MNLDFGVETKKILDLVINSLYTNKDIAIRELISNSSDALDKIKYLSVSNENILDKDEKLEINIKLDNKSKTITISDNGVGMNKEDLIDKLGTIARSGTEEFINNLEKNKKDNPELIGKFGVGFYSAFMIADKVNVITRKYDSKQIFKWSYNISEEKFQIDEVNDSTLKRGTEIILYLKKDCQKDYNDKFRIKNIISTYSNHIPFDIKYIDQDNKDSEVLNKSFAIWTKNPKDVTKEEYKEFYQDISHLPDDPYMIIHNKLEGNIEYCNLFFVPSTKPFDLFNPDRKSSIKLYVKKVFISEDLKILPSWLRFVKGVIDSSDLSLNISRENLQHTPLLAKISRSAINKILAEIKKKSKKSEEYEIFWKNFGAVLKEGLCEATDFKDKILEISRFYSSRSDNQIISLDQYIDNMQENQKDIYYLTGASLDKIKSSPQIEKFIKNNIEVLFLVDPVDDFWVNVINKYKDKDLKSINKSDIDLDNLGKKEDDNKDDAEKKEKDSDEKDITNSKYDELLKLGKEILKDKAKDVILSKKLTNSVVCLSVDNQGMDIRMERYLKEQNQLSQLSKKILEINPDHEITSLLLDNLDNKDIISDIFNILFDQASVIEGEEVNDLKLFSNNLSKLISSYLSKK